MTTQQHMTNGQRSAAEVDAFIAEKPSEYFAYRCAKVLRRNDKIGTWIGDELARVEFAGQPFTSNMGDLRQNFRARGVNGVLYSGTAYLSSGDYVRMRAVKS